MRNTATQRYAILASFTQSLDTENRLGWLIASNVLIRVFQAF